MSAPADAWRRAFVGASVLWALALPLASFAASRPAPANGWYAIAVGLYAAGSLVCHQLPARSFQLWSAQMPVCARCTGIYAGGALAAIVLMALDTSVAIRGTDRRRTIATLVVSSLPTGITLVYEWATGQPSSNLIRALAGVPIGAAVASMVVAWCRPSRASGGLPDNR